MAQGSSPPTSVGGLVFVTAAPPDAVDWRLRIEHELETRHRLATGVDEADLLLVVIGRNFVETCRENASVEEVMEQALSREMSIVPILVEGADMPNEAELPVKLRDLSHREAVNVQLERNVPGMIARLLATASIRPRKETPKVNELGDEQPSVFIAYRRDDSGYWAGVLARGLSKRVRREHVFFDTGSQRPGHDYRPQISGALARATDVVVVIGPGFLERNSKGTRRIDSHDDQLRSEIRTALQDKKRMHIVLAGQANAPLPVELPDDIVALLDTQSVHRLRSVRWADRIANEMFAPAARSSRFASGNRALVEMRQAQRALEDHAKSVLDELAAHGWTDVSEHFNGDKVYRVRNDRFKGFRLEVHVYAAAVCLEERTASLLRAGLPRWVTRDVVSVSPNETTAAKVMRLPDELLDASLDPCEYLDRRGRMRVNKRKHPLMRHHAFLGSVRAMTHPNMKAIEAYQRMRRHTSARGGLRVLRRIETLRLDAGDARGIGFHPSGEWLAIATDSGATMVETRNWQVDGAVESRASWQAVGCSQDGWLALGSDHGRLSIWNPAGVLIADRVAPCKPGGFVHRLFTRRDPAITEVSWSPTGEAVAWCDGVAAWIYSPATGGVQRWTTPALTPPPLDHDCGAHFIAGCEALLVYGLQSFVCVLRLPNLLVESVIQKPIRRKQELIADQTGARSGGAPFSDIYCAAPDPAGNVVACAGRDGQVALYDRRSWELLGRTAWFEPILHGMRTQVSVVSFSPDGLSLAAICGGQRLVIGNAATLEPVCESPEALDLVLGGTHKPRVAWSPDSSMIALNRLSGLIEIWKL